MDVQDIQDMTQIIPLSIAPVCGPCYILYILCIHVKLNHD